MNTFLKHTTAVLSLLLWSRLISAAECETEANKFLETYNLGTFSKPAGSKTYEPWDSEDHRLNLRDLENAYARGLKEYTQKHRYHDFQPPPGDAVWTNGYASKGGRELQDRIRDLKSKVTVARELSLRNQIPSDATYRLSKDGNTAEVFLSEGKIVAIGIHLGKEDRQELIQLNGDCKVQAVSEHRNWDELKVNPRVCASLAAIKSEAEIENPIRPLVEPLGGKVPFNNEKQTHKRSGDVHAIERICAIYKPDFDASSKVGSAPKIRPAPAAPSGTAAATRDI